MNKIRLSCIGWGATKIAKGVGPGDIIRLEYGYTFLVEHALEESEYWNGEMTHKETYPKDMILGLATSHANRGLC
ncbi:MAG: hypothetical protein GY705_00475 [Bacteroidetes bacterium]|nr:hypothetical protein [Bacteroidota bacterium]